MNTKACNWPEKKIDLQDILLDPELDPENHIVYIGITSPFACPCMVT